MHITTNVVSSKLDTLCDKVCQWLAAGRWFSQYNPISSTNKTDRHDINAPPKIEKNLMFLRKIVIFHTKYPQKIARFAPLGALILSVPPNLKSWIRPW